MDGRGSISPDEVEQRTEAKRERGQIGEWTGYWFVNVGEGEGRSWEDCVRYGFISAGGDERAQRDMMKLQPNGKVFAYISEKGYVGYGVVTEPAVMARDFKTADGATLLAQSLKGAERLGADRDDDTRAEYLVGVKWEKTFDRDHAQWESGMFYGQSTIF